MVEFWIAVETPTIAGPKTADPDAAAFLAAPSMQHWSGALEAHSRIM